MSSPSAPLLPPDVAGQPPARVYLLGAAGCGMSALGHLLLDLGYGVAGSDLLDNEEAAQLRRRGARIYHGHHPEQVLREKPDLLVYSSAVGERHPELAAARAVGAKICRRAILLAELLRRKRGVCVAGMHGKTTTTALLAYALDRLGAHPSYAVGSLVPQLVPHARFDSAGEYFVVETDESDGTQCAFTPEVAVLLNVDAEHLDFYADLDAVCREFARFARQATGWVLWCADDPRLAAVVGGGVRALSFGYAAQADYRVEPLPADDGVGDRLLPCASRFRVWRHEACLGEFRFERLRGEKNLSNATAAIALLHQLGFAPADIASALRPFAGAARRQQRLYRGPEGCVIEDYGHHPREIVATLETLKPAAGGRLLVAFQPHRYTRTRHLMTEFSTCFALADRLWLTEVYAASEEPLPGVDGQALANAVRATGQTVEYVPELERLPDCVRAELKSGDTALFLGAGDIGAAARRLATQLRQEQAARRERWWTDLSRLLSPASAIRRDEPMSKHTTLRVGGPADLYLEPGSEAELAAVLKYCAAHDVPCRVMGRGSNLLVRDGGIRGVVVCLGTALAGIEVEGQSVHCGAGARLREVVMTARNHGLGGLEFLEGVPGSVGGAMRMNAGAQGRQFYDVVQRVRYLDRTGAAHEAEPAALGVAYRDCALFQDHIAVAAVLTAVPRPREEIDARLAEHHRQRWDSQPAAPSAGCVFKNPAAGPAGAWIDRLGLKGRRVGGAVVSPLHANFIVNEGQASARDVLELMEQVQTAVRAGAGVELRPEVEIVGEEPDPAGLERDAARGAPEPLCLTP